MMNAPEHECQRKSDEDSPISLAQVLVDEFKAIHAAKPDSDNPNETDETKKLKAVIQDLHAQKRAGLCLSGGGIRSATFALGILQGLARCGLLDKFHYLSTVSGGGYIGSWLTAWIYQVTKAKSKEGCASADKQWDSHREQALEEVISELHNVQKDDPLYPEASPVRHLRQYSNYLSPKVGFLSADTWTLVAIYLRNLIVNWLVLVPLSVALLAIPRLSVAIVAIRSGAIPRDWLNGLLGVGCVLLVLALIYMGFNLPRTNTKKKAGQGMFLLCCLMPLILSAAILTTWFAWFYPSYVGNPKLYASFAAPAVLTVILLLLTLFILVWSWFFGTGKSKLPDIDLWLEWCARSGAWVIIAIVSWAGLSTLVLFGPDLPPLGWKCISAAGGISGLITVLLGASAKTKPKPQGPTDKGGVGSLLISKGPQFAAPLFAAFLVVLISAGTAALLRNYLATDQDVIREAPLRVACFALIICGLGGIGCILSLIVNVNIFSIHGMYRDRLIRAYLGASRLDGERKPHPFTGFDPKDNFAMHCLWPDPDEPLRQPIPEAVRSRVLFPVVNITLNLVHGKNLAWQERKAESFTVTPLHCGSWAIGRRNPEPKQRKGYRRTDVECPQADKASHIGYADGITLGTAVAISGAAASPNMGYHSSPLVTLLMTLFNVRLGWWLGNPGPAGTETYKRWFPRFGIKPILAEAFGLTNDENKYVYLSDGGHFENLGLYEMVLRRCHYIVVSDAGQDADCKFVDLGEAVRKIRIDLGIPIEFDEMFIYARSDDPVRNKAGRRCAIGYIKYSAVDGDGVEDGVLIYIKPACYGYEPRDVYEYYKRSALFPHESTVNQFFTESQFESYRMLGVYTMQQLCGDEKLEGFKQFRRKIERYLK
jgi:hypothetical protein